MSKAMLRVAQLDANGCVVASLAMVTGKTYEQVREEIQRCVGHFKDGEWVEGNDFAQYGVSAEITVNHYLTQCGFASQHRYHCNPRTNQPREQWPELWVKGIPTFRGYIASVTLNGNQHAVAVTEHGTVIDPWREGIYTLADYPDVNMLIAVFELPSDTKPTA